MSKYSYKAIEIWSFVDYELITDISEEISASNFFSHLEQQYWNIHNGRKGLISRKASKLSDYQ